ncbi:MAG: GatB/YqeY domain-containing protein [Actinomycetota bacterium]|nr:GatB/YqeY domain-containing protein [Actinomycetota bacterium]
MPLLEEVKSDVTAALKAGDKERAGALRLVVSELQKAAKEGSGGNEVQVLQRERKRRLESAKAYREGGREDLASVEEREAQLIDTYLPEQLSDEELHAIVGDAVAELGASSPKEMGKVMAIVMPRVEGRADGRRVSDTVRELLSP